MYHHPHYPPPKSQQQNNNSLGRALYTGLFAIIGLMRAMRIYKFLDIEKDAPHLLNTENQANVVERSKNNASLLLKSSAQVFEIKAARSHRQS